MRTILILGLTILISEISPAQCDSSYFRNTGTLVYDLLLIDSNKIVAVGDNGYVIKSIDGGNSWKNIPTFQPYFLRAICAATDSTLYAVGSYQTILKSEDQGESWFPLHATIKNGNINVAGFFNDVFFLDKNKGFIVADDGVLISTNDGGRSWKDTVFSNFSTSRLNSVTFINQTLGFISGTSNFLYRTRDAGVSWERIDVDFLGFNRDIKKVTFVDALRGFAVGADGLIIKTIDGGSTWTGNTTGGAYYYDICFINSQTGFIGGVYAGGMVLKTTDGGNSWSRDFNALPDGPSSCYSVATDPTRKKVLFGGGGASGEFLGYNGRNILCTTDAGASYQYLSGNGRTSFYSTCFINDSTGFISGDYGLCYKTSDYGESWKPLQTIPFLLANPGSYPNNIFFIDKKYGFASTDAIYKTSNGGSTWDPVSVPGSEAQIFPGRMHFFDSLTGVVMDPNNLYRTSNAGTSWSTVLTASFFTDFCFLENGNGFAVGYDGLVFTSSDKGITWNPFDLHTNDYLTCVYFYNNSLGFIGSADSILYKTTDGGASWTRINLGLHPQMRSMIFLDDSTGYLICSTDGGTSTIRKTKNGGLTWFDVDFTGEHLSRFSGFETIYTAGTDGFIFKTDRLHVPGLPGYIYGPGVNCLNTESAFITGPLQGVSYVWSLSGGGVNAYAQNKDTVSWNQPGSYTLGVNISNACGTGPTMQTNIIVYKPTVIDSQPASQTVCAGSPAMLSVVASGDSISYQWKKQGVNIPGAINANYKISSADRVDSSAYSVTVTGLCGAVTSAVVNINVRPADSCLTALPQIPDLINGYVLMPNLVTDHAMLKCISRRSMKVNWSVIDANGHGVIYLSSQLTIGENKLDLPLRRLSSGTYYIVGSTSSGILPPIRFVKL